MGLNWPVIVIILATSHGQILPENSCSQYFQYVNNGDSFEGEVTLPTIVQGRNRVDVRFAQRDQQNQAVVGGILPYPDVQTIRSNVASPKFRITLWPHSTTGILPKLTRLAFNDATLCTASEYNPPNTYFNRFYELHVSGRIGSKPPTSSAIFNPFADDEPDVIVKTLFFDQTGQLPWQRVPIVETSNRDPPPVRWPTVGDTLSPQSAPSIWEFRPGIADITTATARLEPPSATPPPPSPPAKLPPPPASSPPVFQPSFTPPSNGLRGCGFQGRVTPFIHNGTPFPRGGYPWLAAIYHTEHFSLQFKCGGSLVSRTQVITAGHCVYKIKEDHVQVELGRYDLNDFIEDGAVKRKVTGILVHPEFSTLTTADADIAILTMHKTVDFDDIISPICLWQESDSKTVAVSGSVAGWGKDENGNTMSQFPRVAEARIVTMAECLTSWVAVQRITKRTLCAGNRDGSGPCIGDSGGGLMVKINNRWLLRGIVSLGERGTNGQCSLDQYVLYCDLSEHVSWINENVR
ncbi:proclotting enzyme [Drosophila tropicalis]|uniref:proclotting enzyme n=1 Tax=Drosophila tropicalis TaxID=46794 RepID=UPI0035AC2554